MKAFQRISITALAILLVIVAGASVHYMYEQHLSSGYAPILKAVLKTTSMEERTQYIHEAREFVSTDKDQETEAKMERMQEDLSGETTSAECGQLFAVSSVAESAREASHYSPDADAAYKEADHQLMNCRDQKDLLAQAEADKFYPELRATAGLPLN
jgi:hypothetical protein